MADASAMTTKTTAIAAIRASILLPIVTELDKHGGKTDMLLAGHGVLRSQLEDAYAFVPLARYAAIFEDAADLLREPHLGAKLGALVRPADLGPIGLLVSTSATIRLALGRLAKFVTALQGATHSGIIDEGDRMVWSYRLSEPKIWPRLQDAEFSLAATHRIALLSFSPSIRPLEVHFEHGSPRDASALQRIFRVPLLFGQSANRLVYAAADADRVHRVEDRDLTRILERHIGDLLTQTASDRAAAEQVRAIIDIYLGHKPITIGTVAAELGLSPRTLQRRLADEGTSLRDLVRTHRRDLAILQIAEGAASTARIAETLGYADSTVFWRAFKSWTGRTPTGR